MDPPKPIAEPRSRVIGATALSSLAVALAILALVISYTGRAALRAQPFADRAVAALQDPAVHDDVADQLTNALVGANVDLGAIRPLIRSLAGAVLQTRAFTALFRRAVVEAHTTVVARGGGTAFVNVADSGVLLQGVLQRLAPKAASGLAVDRVAKLLTLRPDGTARTAIDVAKALYAAVRWLLAATALLAAAALWVSVDRARTASRLGIGLAAGGVLIAGCYFVGAAVVEAAAPAGRGAAAGALWRAFLDGLQVQALILAGAGAVLAAAARASSRSGVDAGRAGVRGWLERIGAPAGSRLGRPALALLAGILIVLEPAAALRAATLAAGLGVVYAGGAGLLTALAGWRPRLARAGRAPSGGRGGGRSRLSRWTPAGVGLCVLALAVGVIATGGGDEAPASATPPTCNGYVVLCDRRLDNVVLPATHNSMASVTIKSWLFGQQDGTIKDQLEYGIRGLLIDSYFGLPTGGRVETDLSSLPKRDVAERELGSRAVAAAEAIRSRIGKARTGARQIYLCHGFCELGAVTLDSALRDLRTFLVSNPGEVVVIVNQDEGVPPTDIERAFAQNGMLDLVYRGPLGPFPTLREMIDSGQRLVVMAENNPGTVPWYHLAYQAALQETPYRFKSANELVDSANLPASCRPNRGPASAPLFLLNHWVDTTPVPRASLAKVVNAYAPLLRRAQTCEHIRHLRPNLVAVDFYREGDVVGVARTLNGIGS